MCDSSSSSSESRILKSSSVHCGMTEDLKSGSNLERSPANKDHASLPVKSIEERTKKAGTSDDEDRKKNQNHPISSGLERSELKYTTNTRLIKRKLEQLKAEMQKLSERHRCTRPERKAYHPFVWNSLSPYRNTAEIDYLLAGSSNHHGGDRRPSKTMRTEKFHPSH